MTATLSALLDAAIARDPARPLVTYYDRDSGERTELSGTTFANWVAKSANLLRDDLDVHAGSTVALALPMHWHQIVLAFATWAVGGCVSESPQDSPDVLVMSPGRLMELADADAGELLVSSLDPMGRALEPRPDHVLDYTSEVRVHPDAFAGAPIDPSAPAYAGGSIVLDHAHAAQTALELAERLSVGEGTRLLVPADAPAEAGLLGWAVPPLVAGGSLVLVRAGDDADAQQWRARVSEQEGVSAVLGSPGVAG
ncbi:TIGR03089 family protein [Blastococcus sp. Marseille-P5729]|uniref:TIGR03089 family protein n=1 Tax=Blastococcus sp. Marseille-P5729 TaxID=2086582 RepID=UPI000D0E42B6|nr:TIGR03089 family protein [Blastococcus sp. Marseille-P5729]